MLFLNPAPVSNPNPLLQPAACSLGDATSRIPMVIDGTGLPVAHATLPTNHAMLSALCSPKCIYQQSHVGAVSEDMGLAIKFSRLEERVQDVKAIVKAELAEVEARLQNRYGRTIKACLPIRQGKRKPITNKRRHRRRRLGPMDHDDFRCDSSEAW